MGGRDVAAGAVYARTGSTLNINTCKIHNNHSRYGGGVANDGIATITYSEIFNNHAHWGGGLINTNDLTIRFSVIRNNSGANAGGVFTWKTLLIEKSILRDNSSIYGGGVSSFTNGVATVRNCTLYGNRAAGGALYTRGTGRIIATGNNLYNNQAGSEYAVLNDNPDNDIDARYNWWGRSEGPGTYDASARVTTTSYNINPVLSPTYLTCKVAQIGGEVRRGPSEDDLVVTPNIASPIAVRARAFDEAGGIWYGFEHPNRRNVLSWLKSTDVNFTGGCVGNDLPDLSIRPNNDYGDSLTITHLPLRTLANREQIGFAWFNAGQYGSTGGWHTGFDFFPPPDTTPPIQNDNVDVLAVAGGIVVGIGEAESSAPPGNWGAAGAGSDGYNLIVRTGRYFLLYGHLGEVHPSLHLGARVGAATVLGKLIPQLAGADDNTHLHLEVRGFTLDQLNGLEAPVRCGFGSVHTDSAEKPRGIDPMRFVQQRGLYTSTDGSGFDHYVGARLLSASGTSVTFNYFGYANWDGEDTATKCFRFTAPIGFFDLTDEECTFAGPNCP